MATKFKFAPRGSARSNEVRVSGTITIGASGAVSASSSEASTVVKTGGKTGRYTVTLDRKYKNPRFSSAPCLIGPADVALTATDGNEFFVRNLTGQTFDIQAYQTSFADANPASGNVIHWSCYVQE